MNLFAYDTKTRQTRKVTDFTEYDCKFPAASQQSIVFENGGYIWKYDVATKALNKVTINLADDDLYSRTELNRSVRVSEATLSPDGKRVVAIGRGDLFLLPASQGPVFHLAATPESHERGVTWSPDGKNVAWLSDASGEYQVWMAPADDLTNARQLTNFTNGYPDRLQWSHDSKKLYFNTEKRDVYELSIGGGTPERILVSETSGIRSFTLSPDGTWAA